MLTRALVDFHDERCALVVVSTDPDARENTFRHVNIAHPLP